MFNISLEDKIVLIMIVCDWIIIDISGYFQLININLIVHDTRMEALDIT